jgi:hypothetical protein
VVRCHSFALGSFEERRVFTMIISLRFLTHGLGRLFHASPTLMTSSKWQNVP